MTQRKSMPIQISPALFLIPLDQDLPGFTTFISAWLYRGEKTFLVDPGPAATIPKLIQSLDRLAVTHLDAVLLTHIHIDHAGGIGDLVGYFPDTPVVCHESAVTHLVDPTRLWEGSLKTLGATAKAYGPIRPVPGDVIVVADRYDEPAVQSIDTPGHAVHHVSYLVEKALFSGEAGGVVHRFTKDRTYMRPATPPRFFLETSIKSIDALMAVPHELLCFGHFGISKESPKILGAHKEQIFKWAEIIRGERAVQPESGIVDHCMARLLQADEHLASWPDMDPLVQARERGFMSNSIRGFLGYFESLESG